MIVVIGHLISTKAQILLKVEKEDKELLKKHLLCNVNVNTIYKINNGWDYMVETVHKSIKELDNFIDTLNNRFKMNGHEVHYLIDEIKKEGFEFQF